MNQLHLAYANSKFLTLGRSSIYNQTVKKHTIDELQKDTFGTGDLTCQLLGKNQNKTVQAQIKAKADGILAGMAELKWFLQKNNLRILENLKDGTSVKKSDIVIKMQGKAKNILQTERVGLNLIQRMSGIATLTAENVKKIPNHILLAGTRKTLWGLLDKKAIVIGGGVAHRLGLWHAILIKENHLKLADHQTVLEQAWFAKKRGAFIEIEVESHAEAIQCAQIIHALFAQKPQKNPVVMMLDDFALNEIEKTAAEIKKIEPQIRIEISGGINQTNLAEYGKLKNIDVISCGFLTHSAKNLDLSLKIK